MSLHSLPESTPMPGRVDLSALQRRLRNALRWHPGIDAARVAISVDGAGRATLEGSVPTYADKCSVEKAVKGVSGVAGVRNRLEVRLTIADYRTDAALERILADLFEFLSRMPPERPHAAVVSGWVTIDGTVLRPDQKQLIEKAVREIAGVKGITNRLVVERAGRRQASDEVIFRESRPSPSPAPGVLTAPAPSGHGRNTAARRCRASLSPRR